MRFFLQKRQIVTYLVVMFFYARVGLSQAPANLTTDVALTATGETDFAPSAFFSSTAQIVAAFNAGRRAEETQLGLTANALGTLTLPSGYTSMSSSQRALFLINAERQARAGINYGSGAVLGKTMEAVETNLNNTAQTHADYLFNNNLFTHTGSGGTTPPQRIEATYPTNCLQRNGSGQYTLSRSENIYRACGGGTTFIIEQAIFSWIYRDTASSWGHREAILIQNVDASGNTGYTDDRTLSGIEGFLGIGVTTGSGYTPCGSLAARIVVLNIADPSSDASCTFAIEANPLPVSLLYWRGSLDQSVARLEWATEWEKNANYFVVQRSADLLTFKSLGNVQAKGTSQEKQTYSFMDEAPQEGNNYYRLVQFDFDGKQEEFRSIKVFKPYDENAPFVYPNPVATSDIFSVKADEGQSVSVRLISPTGVEIPIKQWRLNSKNMAIQPAVPLPTGVFTVVTQVNGQSRQTKLLIK